MSTNVFRKHPGNEIILNHKSLWGSKWFRRANNCVLWWRVSLTWQHCVMATDQDFSMFVCTLSTECACLTMTGEMEWCKSLGHDPLWITGEMEWCKSLSHDPLWITGEMEWYKSLSHDALWITGEMEWCKSLSHDLVSVNCIQFTHDTKRVVVGMANGSVSVCIIVLC